MRELTLARSLASRAKRLQEHCIKPISNGMIAVMGNTPKKSKGTKPELIVHPATEPSPEMKARIAAVLGQELSGALEQAVREHEGDGAPGVA